jgi:hypothetical protein
MPRPTCHSIMVPAQTRMQTGVHLCPGRTRKTWATSTTGRLALEDVLARRSRRRGRPGAGCARRDRHTPRRRQTARAARGPRRRPRTPVDTSSPTGPQTTPPAASRHGRPKPTSTTSCPHTAHPARSVTAMSCRRRQQVPIPQQQPPRRNELPPRGRRRRSPATPALHT